MQVLLRFRLRGPKIVTLSSNMTRYFPPSPRFFTSRRQNLATNSIVRQAAGRTKNACASFKFFEDIDFLGSSRFPGKGGLDFQEEPVCVSEPVGHSFDDLYADVDAFEQAGVHRESALARIPRVLFQAPREGFRRCQPALTSLSLSPSAQGLANARGVPDVLSSNFELYGPFELEILGIAQPAALLDHFACGLVLAKLGRRNTPRYSALHGLIQSNAPRGLNARHIKPKRCRKIE